jgi:hypothetical protein
MAIKNEKAMGTFGHPWLPSYRDGFMGDPSQNKNKRSKS